ncbi:MAG: glycosyltransferase family 39 protein [Bacteroidota bacterium]
MTIQKKFLILILLTVCSRGLFLALFPGLNYYNGISNGFLHVADNVLDGRGLTTYVDLAPLNDSSHQWSYEPFIDRPLGYLAIVLLPYSLVRLPLSIQIFQLVLSVCSVVLCYKVAERLFSEKTAFVASLLYSVWPLSARFEIALLGDSVVSLFLLISLWAFMKGLENRVIGTAFASGAALGAGILMRSDLSFLPFFLLGVVYFVKRSSVAFRFLAPYLVGVFLVVGMQTARNYTATNGSFLPLGLGKGISMWEGISQFGDTLGTVYGDEKMTQREGYHSWAYPNGVERDQKRFREALNIIRAHPVWYGGIMARRVLVLLRPDGIILGRLMPAPSEFLERNPGSGMAGYLREFWAPAACQVLLIILQISILLLAARALVEARDLSWLPGIIILYYVFIHIPTNAESRYFYPAIPVVLILAARGYELIRKRSEAA